MYQRNVEQSKHTVEYESESMSTNDYMNQYLVDCVLPLHNKM